VNVDALGKSYHRTRSEQDFRRDRIMSPRQRPVRLLCNDVRGDHLVKPLMLPEI
jgi:hypothetical protein